MRLTPVGHRIPIVLLAATLALLVPLPSWANNPDYRLLRYPFFLWPVGAVLTLAVLALVIAVWRQRQPSRRLVWALIMVSAAVIPAWPYVVYTMGLGFAPQQRPEDLIALVPPLVAAAMGLVGGRRAMGRASDPDQPI